MHRVHSPTHLLPHLNEKREVAERITALKNLQIKHIPKPKPKKKKTEIEQTAVEIVTIDDHEAKFRSDLELEEDYKS